MFKYNKYFIQIIKQIYNIKINNVSYKKINSVHKSLKIVQKKHLCLYIVDINLYDTQLFLSNGKKKLFIILFYF